MDEDLKGEFSNNETNNENLQKKLKQLKHSQGSYIGHITKAINKIDKFIIDKEHIEQIKYLEEQLEKHIKKLKIVIDEYCDISESPEQHDIMNECFLEQNARVLNHRGCSQMGGGKKAPLPKICHTYPIMMKLGTVIPYLKKIQKIYESRDAPPDFC